MKILLVRKPTNFELHGQRVKDNVRRGYQHPSDYEHLRLMHDQHYRTVDDVTSVLNKRQISFQAIQRDAEWPKAISFDAVITIGGDGTLLSAAQHLPEGGMIVGLRSSAASVGYTCASDPDHIAQTIEKLLDHKLEFIEVERMLARVHHRSRDHWLQSVPILNDVLFTNCNPAATTQYELRCGLEREVQKSSGVWISTAVGSTAGILAAGGQAIAMTDRRFQFRVREVYQLPEHRMRLQGGLFDPEDVLFSIENRNETALVAFDGQHGQTLLDFGDQIQISRGPKLRIARPVRHA